MDGSLEPDRLGELTGTVRSVGQLYRLSWFRNGDGLQVAVAANRLAAAGFKVWRCLEPEGAAEAGDYLVEASTALAGALHAAGIRLEPWAGKRARSACPIKPAAVAVLAGKASAYPYYGYYALALARLGYAFRPVDGSDIAGGALERENLLVLPGGFSNWGLDSKEEAVGADLAVRSFLAGGGGAVASCGGAYYLSRGRSAWLGLADARPVFTQEYLRTGVGVVTCRLEPGRHRLGLPPTIEIPYFHGPVYDELGPGSTALATFRDLYGHGRLFIDNSLSEETFRRDMQGRVAAVRACGPRGQAVLFSPHPEMGELLRKYMSLETYIPRYLPVRGELVMRETLDSFRPQESRSFLMVLNAVEDLLQAAPESTGPADEPPAADEVRAATSKLVEAWRTRAAAVEPSPGGVGDLERHILAGLERRLAPAAEQLDRTMDRLPDSGGDGARIAGSFAVLAAHACAAWADPPERRPAELLLEIELALLCMEAWVGMAEIHIVVRAHA